MKNQLEKSNVTYKLGVDRKIQVHSFAKGDLVYAHLRKERFLRGTYNKMKLKNIGPCKILRKISNNAYVLEFPKDLETSSTLNIYDLYKFE